MKQIQTKELQQMKLKLLLKIDEICNENQITYFLAYGTLLGAVREKGYIAWDEDIDLWMPREDYERFNLIAQKLLGDAYFLQNYNTDIDLVHPISRVCINGTYRCEPPYVKCRFHKGSFIDIFPLDNVPDDKKAQKTMYDECKKDENLLKFKYCVPASKTKWKLLMRKTIKVLMNVYPAKKLYRRLLGDLTQYRIAKSEYIGCPCISSATPERFIYRKSLFEESVYLEFEGFHLPCPAGYHELLTQLYGEYMIPPGEKDRKIDSPTYYLV